MVSVDTKKNELVGQFKNAGREWQRAGEPVAVSTHDFPDAELGKAIPYGIYDLAADPVHASRTRLCAPASARTAARPSAVRLC